VQGGFRFEGLPRNALPEGWLSDGTRGCANARVVLGPEPIIGPQAVVLGSRAVPRRTCASPPTACGPSRSAPGAP
jgi:general secretion pathway protein H